MTSSRHLPRLGEVLVERGLATPEDVEGALALQRSTGRRLGEALVELGVVAPTDLAKVLASHVGVRFVDLDERTIDVAVATLVTRDVALRYRAVPVELVDGHLLVAMADPRDVFALDDLRVLTGHPILPALADVDQIENAIDRVFNLSAIAISADDSISDVGLDDARDDDTEAVDEGPIVRLIDVLLEQASLERASDVHIEPRSDRIAIRLRVDGLLHEATSLPRALLRPMLSRLKVLGGLDIAQSRLAQDGRFSLRLADRLVDIRIATVPTAVGEAAVLRLLDPQRTINNLNDLDLAADDAAKISAALQANQGAILVTGPTGAGKSTTVYAALGEINTADRSIVSVEDPVEYQVDAVKQVAINSRAGMTFPGALRSLLRADPDVIVIGEVRDKETARIAAEAAVTGHLVLSTLHTTSASAAPIRLIDMGVEPYLVASALTCVVSQRLLRRLCERCATIDTQIDRELLRRLGAPDALLEGPLELRRSVGCGHCLGTGYRGRIAILEIMPVNEELHRAIVDRAPTAEVRRIAIEQGMSPLRVTAMQRVIEGQLTIEEMIRVIG